MIELDPTLPTRLGQLLTNMPNALSSAEATAYEHALAEYFDVPEVIAVSSGTAALHTSLVALGVNSGEVLVPALSVMMSITPVVHAGVRPVFVDCNAEGTDFDYADLARKISPRTKAILPVWLWGRAGNPVQLVQFASEHSLPVVEDACQAHGTKYRDQLLGTFGDLGCFSTKDGKLMWSGEGGFIVTKNADLAANCRAYRNHWLTPPPGERPLEHVGQNYRLSEPLAMIARANLARFDSLLAQRQHQAAFLSKLLDGAPGLEPYRPSSDEHWNGYTMLATLDIPRPRDFCLALAEAGIANSVGTFRLIACDQRPPFRDKAALPCVNAQTIIDHTLAVIVTELTADDDLEQIAATIRKGLASWQ